MTYDWTQFTKRIPINASIESVYELWTTQAGLEKWFLRKAEFTAVDGRLRNSTFSSSDLVSFVSIIDSFILKQLVCLHQRNQ